MRGDGAFPFAPGRRELVGFVFREAAGFFGREAKRGEAPPQLHGTEASVVADFDRDAGGQVGSIIKVQTADVERLAVKAKQVSSGVGAVVTGHEKEHSESPVSFISGVFRDGWGKTARRSGEAPPIGGRGRWRDVHPRQA